MASPLRRSTRGARNADAAATTPEPPTISPSASPSKLDRKRKRADEPVEPSNRLNGSDEQTPASVTLEGVAANHSSITPDRADNVDADAARDASLPKKAQLPNKIRSLLGLPGSSTPAQRSKSAAISSAAQKVDELVLREEDANKLVTILDTLDAADWGAVSPPIDDKGKSRSANGSSTTASDLKDVLRPGASLRDLRARLISIREPLLADSNLAQHLQAGHGLPPSETVSKDVARLSCLTLIIGLVDQLATRLRQADDSTEALKGQILGSIVEHRARYLEAKNARKADATDASDDDTDFVRVRPVRLPTDDQPTNRYALHMRLPRGDYFTKAIALDRAQLSHLDPAQADLVQISAQSEAQMRALKRQGLVPTPTLGQRLGKSGPRHRTDTKRTALQQQPRPQPVTFLNYGNYSSFAPTYDSSASTISYATSAMLWRSSIQAQHSVSLTWGEKPFQSYELTEQEDEEFDANTLLEPTYGTMSAALRSSGSKANEIVDVDGDTSMAGPQSDELATVLHSLLDGPDGVSVNESLKTLNRDEMVSSHLRFNMMLLHRLQEFQWARLRRSYAPTLPGRKASSSAEEEPPSAEEEATATLLLESLSSLVALQPRAVDLVSDKIDSVVPEASKLRAFSVSSGAIDPDLLGDVRDGFWGALDANVVKVTKGGVTSETPLVLRDNDTIRLVDGSGSKAKKSARRAGPGTNQPEDRGRGVLERFAANRAYDHKHDRHDVEPIRTTPAAGNSGSMSRDPLRADVNSPGARSGTPLAASPQPRQHGVAMSPNARMHGSYGPGTAPPAPPQGHRMPAGPNASYAFAGPAASLSHVSRPMQPSASFAHAASGQSNWSAQVGANVPRQ